MSSSSSNENNRPAASSSTSGRRLPAEQPKRQNVIEASPKMGHTDFDEAVDHFDQVFRSHREE